MLEEALWGAETKPCTALCLTLTLPLTMESGVLEITPGSSTLCSMKRLGHQNTAWWRGRLRSTPYRESRLLQDRELSEVCFVRKATPEGKKEWEEHGEENVTILQVNVNESPRYCTLKLSLMTQAVGCFELYTSVESYVKIRTGSCFLKLGWAVYGPSTDGAAPLSAISHIAPSCLYPSLK